MTADPYLEEAPVTAIHTLLARALHTSRRPPIGLPHRAYRPRPLTCVAELYQDWYVTDRRHGRHDPSLTDYRSIVDGLNSGTLNGVDTFLKSTAGQTVRDPFDYDIPSDACDDAFAPDRFYYGFSRQRGPNNGDTYCSWCVLNYFDRKLESWEEGKVFDSFNGTEISLPAYLRTIRHAGRRCQDSDWNRIFRKNVDMYQEKGWLSEDWDDDNPAASSVEAGHAHNDSHSDGQFKPTTNDANTLVQQV